MGKCVNRLVEAVAADHFEQLVVIPVADVNAHDNGANTRSPSTRRAPKKPGLSGFWPPMEVGVAFDDVGRLKKDTASLGKGGDAVHLPLQPEELQYMLS
jgi:hypothetical protein